MTIQIHLQTELWNQKFKYFTNEMVIFGLKCFKYFKIRTSLALMRASLVLLLLFAFTFARERDVGETQFSNVPSNYVIEVTKEGFKVGPIVLISHSLTPFVSTLIKVFLCGTKISFPWTSISN